MQLCVNTKTGRAFPATRNLVKAKELILVQDAKVIAAYQNDGIRQFEVIKADDGSMSFVPIKPLTEEEALIRKNPYARPLPKASEVGAENVIPSQEVIDGRLQVAKPSMAVTSGDYSVPADFDLDVRYRSMSKPQLLQLAERVDGLLLDPKMSVKDMKTVFGEVITALKGEANAAQRAEKRAIPAQRREESLPAKEEVDPVTPDPVAGQLPASEASADVTNATSEPAAPAAVLPPAPEAPLPPAPAAPDGVPGNG